MYRKMLISVYWRRSGGRNDLVNLKTDLIKCVLPVKKYSTKKRKKYHKLSFDVSEHPPSLISSLTYYACTLRSRFLSFRAFLNILPKFDSLRFEAGRGSSVGCASALYADGRGFDPHARQHSFVEIGHNLYLPLIQEGQLSDTGERMCIKYW